MKKIVLLILVGCLIFPSCTRNETNYNTESIANSKFIENQNSIGERGGKLSQRQHSSLGEDTPISALESIPSISSSNADVPPNSIPPANVPPIQDFDPAKKGSNDMPEQPQNYIVIIPESSTIPTESDHDDIGFLVNVEKEIIRLINEHRISLGLAALQYDDKLKSASRIRSKELYNNGFIIHNRPDGRNWETVLQFDIPIAFKSAGENLASVEHNMPNYDPSFDADYWYATWKNSPGHYENIIRNRFTHVGVGVYYIKKDNMIYAYATTLFTEL